MAVVDINYISINHYEVEALRTAAEYTIDGRNNVRRDTVDGSNYVNYGISARSQGKNNGLKKNNNTYAKYYQRGEGLGTIPGIYGLFGMLTTNLLYP